MLEKENTLKRISECGMDEVEVMEFIHSEQNFEPPEMLVMLFEFMIQVFDLRNMKVPTPVMKTLVGIIRIVIFMRHRQLLSRLLELSSHSSISYSVGCAMKDCERWLGRASVTGDDQFMDVLEKLIIDCNVKDLGVISRFSGYGWNRLRAYTQDAKRAVLVFEFMKTNSAMGHDEIMRIISRHILNVEISVMRKGIEEVRRVGPKYLGNARLTEEDRQMVNMLIKLKNTDQGIEKAAEVIKQTVKGWRGLVFNM